ncbi:hypothetical protein [Streptomyces sp. SGAir0924]|uniref:hypothetical protein n=1 Tax=Streptomyces sp. SGAir0924 TaxID=2109593 RepID=UPI001585E01B|nr:hypothetical protein [Streptomyces sp. SGAir0924]
MGYPTLFTAPGVRQFAEEVDAERQRQLAKFGDQHHPDGTGYEGSERHADFWRKRCEDAFADEEGTWGHVLLEEVFVAMAEADPARLRAELVQVAAVCAGWIADLDSRTTEGTRRVADETAATETQPPAAPVVCEGFVWIGQSFATCDRCGQPAWEHDGQDVAVEGAGPFDPRRTVRPWEPGQADAIRAKWEQPAAGARHDEPDHVCNTVQARGEMDEPLGYLICGYCGTPKNGARP